MTTFLSDSHMQEVAKRTQLSVEELNMHVEHLRLMAQRRKEGAKKAACTKAKKKSAVPVEETTWCWCREGEYSDMIRCEAESCTTQWFHLKCVGLLFFPPCVWLCPDCKVEAEQYCLCNQPEFGLMVACDKMDCTITWFHLACVGLKAAPNGKWICPRCIPTTYA